MTLMLTHLSLLGTFLLLSFLLFFLFSVLKNYPDFLFPAGSFSFYWEEGIIRSLFPLCEFLKCLSSDDSPPDFTDSSPL